MNDLAAFKREERDGKRRRHKICINDGEQRPVVEESEVCKRLEGDDDVCRPLARFKTHLCALVGRDSR